MWNPQPVRVAMRLFQKITVTLLVTITVAAAIAIVAVALIFMPQYEQMDRNAALATAVRVNGALLREIQITTSASGDWGNWDDTRKFSMNQNKDFIETNLSPDAMTAIHSDELMIADLEGRILFQYRVPSSAGNAQVSFIRSQFIPKQHWPNKSGFKPKIKFSGLIATAEGPAIIAMTRVTDSLFTNPVERVLVLIKLLDDKVARTIQNQSGSKLF